MDCVEVCPVDCFYEGKDMLVIKPLECIYCGVCEPECPVDAIVLEDALPDAERQKWYAINETFSNKWPNINQKDESKVPADAEQWNGVPNKYEQFIEEENQ